MRWRTVVGAAVVMGLVGLACVSVVLAQDACTRTYRGDLVLEGNQRLVITEGVLCVGGDIYLSENARLEISNATLRMTGAPEGLWAQMAVIRIFDAASVSMRNVRVEVPGRLEGILWLWMHDASRVELDHVSTSGSGWTGVYVPRSASAVIRNSTLGDVFVNEGGTAQVLNSVISGVTLKFTTASGIELGGLRPAHYESWEVPAGPGLRPRLSLEQTQVGGWRVEVTESAEVAIRDSDLSDLVLYVADSWSVIEGLKPGHYANWSLQGDLGVEAAGIVTLADVSVNLWHVDVSNRRRPLLVRNSNLLSLSFAGSTGQASIQDTTVYILGLEDDSQLVMECEGLTVVRGLDLHRTRLTIRGGIEFDRLYSGAVLRESTVGREYEVQVRDNDGDPVRGMRIGLEDPNGRVLHRTTDQEGVVRFSIWFYNTNYDHTWHLLVPQRDTTARVPITLLTSTPVEVTSW